MNFYKDLMIVKSCLFDVLTGRDRSVDLIMYLLSKLSCVNVASSCQSLNFDSSIRFRK